MLRTLRTSREPILTSEKEIDTAYEIFNNFSLESESKLTGAKVESMARLLEKGELLSLPVHELVNGC